MREIADQNIESQTREIAEMKLLTEGIEAHGRRGNRPRPPVEAEVTPDMLPKIRDRTLALCCLDQSSSRSRIGQSGR